MGADSDDLRPAVSAARVAGVVPGAGFLLGATRGWTRSLHPSSNVHCRSGSQPERGEYPTGVDHRPVRDTASVQSVTIERAVSEISVNGRAESCSREATVGRGRGAWSVWRPLLTRSGVLRERPAGAEVVSVPWKPARRIRPAMRRRVRVIVNACAQCAFVCVCARVRVWLASAGMLLCAPSSIPHCGVCTTAA